MRTGLIGAVLLILLAGPALAQAPATPPPDTWMIKYTRHILALRNQYEEQLAQALAQVDQLKAELAKLKSAQKQPEPKPSDPPAPQGN